MRILVISDTHGRHDYLYRFLEAHNDFEQILHLGDAEGKEMEICRAASCPVEFVRGNKDSLSEMNDTKIIIAGSHKIWMTHGHMDSISRGLDRIVGRGGQTGADLILFGHTHQPLLTEYHGLIVMNPGSISFPRPLGKTPSYGILDIRSDGSIRPQIHYIKE